MLLDAPSLAGLLLVSMVTLIVRGGFARAAILPSLPCAPLRIHPPLTVLPLGAGAGPAMQAARPCRDALSHLCQIRACQIRS